MTKPLSLIAPAAMLDNDSTITALDALSEAKQRLKRGDTSSIAIVEINRDGPRIAYAGVDADPLRFNGLLDKLMDEIRGFVDEVYEL